MEKERPPISEVIEVIECKTLYHTQKWWCAVVLGQQFGKKKVFLYLWNDSGKGWKRKQKFTIGSARNWEDLKPIVDELVAKL